MKRTVLGFVFLFLLAASFTAGFYSVVLAGPDPGGPCGYEVLPTLDKCCWDILDRSGAWYYDDAIGDFVCRCDFYPGWPTIGGPCNCPMDCSGAGGQS